MVARLVIMFPETTERRCPHCQGYSIGPAYQITAESGLIKIVYPCKSCGESFTFVRDSRFTWL